MLVPASHKSQAGADDDDILYEDPSLDEENVMPNALPPLFAKRGKLNEGSSPRDALIVEDEDELEVQPWCPDHTMFTHKDGSGHMNVTVKYNPSSGALVTDTSGLDIHAAGATLSLTENSATEMWSIPSMREGYTEEELKNLNTSRMLDAQEDHIKSILPSSDERKRNSAEIPLPFEVVETKNPKMKLQHFTNTGTQTITMTFQSIVEPTFEGKVVKPFLKIEK